MATTCRYRAGRTRASTLLRATLTGVLLVTGTLLAPAPRAAAGTGAQDPWGMRTPPIQYEGPRKVDNCTVYANKGGFGSICMTSHGDGSYIEKLLKENRLPECWHEPLPGSLGTEEFPQEHGDEQGAYWLRTCLKGVDLTSPAPDLSKVVFEYTVVWIPAGQSPVLLTEDQKALRDWLDQQDRDFPATVAMTSPVVVPRVGQPIAFHLVNSKDVTGPPPPEEITVLDPIPMHAVLVGISVRPVPGTPGRTTCTGRGTPIVSGESPEGRPEVCFWRYQRSSAGQEPEAMYKVRTTLRWDVSYQQNGEWRPLNSVYQETVTELKVAEVQTLVVPHQAAR